MESQKDRFSLTLQELSRSGRQWDEMIPYRLLADETFGDMDVDSPLFTDMQWKGSLEPVEGQYVLTGSWQMIVPRRCGRCTKEFACPMQSDVYTVFALGASDGERALEEEQTEESCDLELVPAPGELNMLDVLREQFWLAWQPMAVCSEDCKGLCLQCGTDLNDESCDCHLKKKDNPFAALANLKFDA